MRGRYSKVTFRVLVRAGSRLMGWHFERRHDDHEDKPFLTVLTHDETT